MICELRWAAAKAARLQTNHLTQKSVSNLPPEKLYLLLEHFDVITIEQCFYLGHLLRMVTSELACFFYQFCFHT